MLSSLLTPLLFGVIPVTGVPAFRPSHGDSISSPSILRPDAMDAAMEANNEFLANATAFGGMHLLEWGQVKGHGCLVILERTCLCVYK